MQLWIKNSLVILLCIIIAAWFAGERIRILDEKYLMDNIREDKIKIVSLLAGLVANAVLIENEKLIDTIIKYHLASWPEITYVNIEDYHSNVIYEWQKRPINFTQGVRHFEQPVKIGTEEYGRLSIYFDLSDYYKNVEEHITYTRRSAASILLGMMLVLVFLVNFVVAREPKDDDKLEDIA